MDYVDAGVYGVGLQSLQRSIQAVKFWLGLLTFQCAADSLFSTSDSDQRVGRGEQLSLLIIETAFYTACVEIKNNM